MLCYDLCYIMLSYVVILCCVALLYYVLLCHVVLYYIILCCVILYTMLCYIYYLLTVCKGRTRRYKPKVFHTA